MLDLFCTIRHCHVQGVLFQVYFSIFLGGCSAVSMVSNCRMSPKIWQRSSLIWILPNYPVLHKYKWKRIQVQIQLQVKFKLQIQAKSWRNTVSETVHVAACGYCHFLPSWTILGCALDKSIFYCCCPTKLNLGYLHPQSFPINCKLCSKWRQMKSYSQHHFSYGKSGCKK